MKSVLSDKDIKINRLAQYNRFSFMLEISGIPFNKNENVSNIIKIVVMLTKITGCEITPVGIAYRTSKRENAPIIILFNKKPDRTNAYKEKKKFHNLHANQYQSLLIVKEVVGLPDIHKERGEKPLTINV